MMGRGGENVLVHFAVLCLTALGVTGCASDKITSFTPDAQVASRVGAVIHPGMPEPDVKAALASVGFGTKWQVSRRDPPGLLARAWPPGGFWVTQDIQTLRYLDIVCDLDAQRHLVSWQTQRGDVTYRFGEPASPGQDPRRRFPLSPLPPEGWGGAW